MRHFRAPLAALIIALLFGIQIWATLVTARQAERETARVAQELIRAPTTTLADEKARQEAIALRIQNATRAYFWNGILSGLGPMITTTVALVGMWLGLLNYLDARDKERLDRAAVDLKEVLERLVSKSPRERAVGVVGLQHFLSPDKQEYHLRVLSALVATARLETDVEVLRGIRLAVEQAVVWAAPGTLRQVSWQGVKLNGVALSGQSLAGVDLRDAVLEDADLSRCDLSGATLINARLNGARLDESVLRGANLTYADLAGASLVRADLRDAVLWNAKVLQMDVDGANLTGARLDTETFPWTLIRRWRNATFTPGVLERLVLRYGAERTGPRVLMLMWEIPPLVAGGTWTACYHLVRALRTRGADVAVVVPWDERSIVSNPFGAEAEVIPLGITPPAIGETPSSAYGATADAPPWSPYAWLRPPQQPQQGTPPAGPYGGPYGSAYGGLHGTPYSSVTPSSYGRPGDGQLSTGSELLRLMEEFEVRVLRLAQRESFDLIHAHDWVTFAAASAAARQSGKPWVAHIHSTEADRRLDTRDVLVEQLERAGVHAARRVITPSRVTAETLARLYGRPSADVSVVPNSLSRDDISPLDSGRFETRRVIFLGRLTEQKGPDLFANIAAEVHRRQPDIQFWVYGSGDGAAALRGHPGGVMLAGPLAWGDRERAFRGASALVVPSRAEPFGMVILEAMQHRVPVLYTAYAGAAEVLESGIRIDPADSRRTAEQLEGILARLPTWEEVVQRQSLEIAGYPERPYPDEILAVWRSALAPTAV